MVQDLWETVCQFLRKLKTDLPYILVILFSGTYPKESWVLKRYLHSYVHQSIIHNRIRQKQTMCQLTDGWTKHNRILFSLKKKGNSDICYNMDEPWGIMSCEMLVAQSCLTLCNPMDSSLSVSSVHGIFQARTGLEWFDQIHLATK